MTSSTENTSNTEPTKKKKSDFHNYPLWTPRFWHGMGFGSWVKLLGKNGYRVSLTRWPMAIAIFFFGIFNSTMNWLQSMIYGRKIKQMEASAPIFIVGHWRSGTTFLHELMSYDTRFACPTTYECFAPRHFLLTRWWVTRLFWWLVPRKRPMDDMKAGWDLPQEDEFALLAMGAPTPYFRMAFPNEAAPYDEFLDMQDVATKDLEVWKACLQEFVQTLTLDKKTGLILKSPPHTGRVGTLYSMFPRAKFIHITRHPEEVYSSTVRLWKSLDSVQGLQVPKHEHLEEYVLNSLEKMYGGFDAQRPQIPSKQIVDVRYDELAANPVEVLRGVYEKLGMGEFERLKPHLEKYMADHEDFKVNRHSLDDETKAKIRDRWASFFETYGYESTKSNLSADVNS
jgi:hypothetical protein